MILRTSRNCSAACKYWPSTHEKRAFPSEHPHQCYVKNISAVRVKAQSQVNVDAGYGMTHATRQWTVCKASAGFARNCDSGSYFSKPPSSDTSVNYSWPFQRSILQGSFKYLNSTANLNFTASLHSCCTQTGLSTRYSDSINTMTVCKYCVAARLSKTALLKKTNMPNNFYIQ